MKRTAIAVAALVAPFLLLCACTTATPYQPLASGTAVSGGYADQAIDDTHFRVSFRGNDMTSREQVETYLLYRAAELTAAGALTSEGSKRFFFLKKRSKKLLSIAAGAEFKRANSLLA